MSVSWPILLLICVVLIAVVLVLFWPAGAFRTKARRSTDRHLAGPIFRNDDRYWYWGIFYINPDDPEMFVPRRFGWGWTVNFGNPRGRLLMLGILLLLLLFGLVIPILVSGTTPVGCHPSNCHWP